MMVNQILELQARYSIVKITWGAVHKQLSLWKSNLHWIVSFIIQQIVKEMLGKYNKKLDQNQMMSLLSKKSSENPLWLSVACEELRVFGLFDKVTDKINSLHDGLLE